jgi:hypothetical protein
MWLWLLSDQHSDVPILFYDLNAFFFSILSVMFGGESAEKYFAISVLVSCIEKKIYPRSSLPMTLPCIPFPLWMKASSEFSAPSVINRFLLLLVPTP